MNEGLETWESKCQSITIKTAAHPLDYGWDSRDPRAHGRLGVGLKNLHGEGELLACVLCELCKFGEIP